MKVKASKFNTMGSFGLKTNVAGLNDNCCAKCGSKIIIEKI